MNFTRSTSLMIVATVFGLWLSVFLGNEMEAVLSYGLILSFGVLHGANDVALVGQYLKDKRVELSKIQVIIGYVLMVIAVWSMFYVYPTLALGTFVLISSYHFGEQHWGKRTQFKPALKALFHFIYGAFILFMIFYINSEQVGTIILEISGYRLAEVSFKYALMLLGVILVTLWGFGSFAGKLHQSILFELFLLGVFYVIFKTASLLLGFCIYFVIWHSVPSLLDQMYFLYGETSWKAFFKYLKNSFVYWMISIVGIVGIYGIFGSENSTDFLMPALICFLAAITFPHVLVMSRIEKYLKTDPKTDVRG